MEVLGRSGPLSSDEIMLRLAIPPMAKATRNYIRSELGRMKSCDIVLDIDDGMGGREWLLTPYGFILRGRPQ